MAALPPHPSWDDDRADARDSGPTQPVPTPASASASASASTELDTTRATAPRQPSPARWSPTVRPDHPLGRGIDPATWPVGFSPTGEALPETLTDVLLRGSHAIRSSKRAEALRLERAAAIAEHVQAQITEFLSFCAAENLTPPVTVRANGRRADRGWDAGVSGGAGSGQPGSIRIPEAGAGFDEDHGDRRVRGGRRGRHDEDDHGEDAVEAEDGPAADRRGERGARGAGAPRDHRRPLLRRERLHAWPLLYWRCESFPAPGRSLHLFVEPGGRTFEGRDDPAPLTVLGREPHVWPVDAPAIVQTMAEVDARRCALHLVHGMAHMLWQAGVGL
ncbi:hypothetical protein Ga0074812_114107 [Parafrankia irregularis]|uniref:Uncharacterized protein n=1 Tax=Parafrankia irregularis TaxID=795642 RepID=A0A0S4QQ79_9ACTN|nr:MULTISPECIES: hypothetical protein [Parafrankia]MBE3204484.1 hypothetical protein [Parafrankia sp. CH37]CUU57760.1 hypothetical protein Ga0074812_114107 [Parafrankia irregularis]